MTHWRAIALATAGLCLASATAGAQTPNNEARASFQEGVRQYGERHYAEALEAFRTAYRVRPHPSVLVNIANCQLALNQPQQALATFERYLTDAAPTLSPAQRTEIESAMAEARRHLATITVVVQPVGADVYLDGDAIGVSPLRRPVETGPGPHVFEARMPGGGPSQQFQARVENGNVLTVTLDLIAGRSYLGAAPEPGVGAASSAAAAAAATAPVPVPAPVTGMVPGPRPVPAPTITPVPAPAITPVPAPVVVPVTVTQVPGPVVVPPAVAPSSHRGIPVVTWVSGVVAVATAGVAIGFGVYANSQTSDYNNVVGQLQADETELHKQPAPSADRQRALRHDIVVLRQSGLAIADSYDQNHTVALVFGATAAAAGIFTVVSYFLFRGSDAQPAVTASTGLRSLRVLPALDGHGLVLGGAF